MTNKEAIFYLKQVREDYEGKEFVEGKEALDIAIKALEERPQGEWITFPTSRLIMQCPECTAFLSRTRSDIFKDSIGEMNFCPNCGADMRGEEE